MNLDQLWVALAERNVSPAACSTDASSETYVIQHRRSGQIGKPDYWVTYYSERGGEAGLREFASEDEACRHFLDWVSADPSARQR